MRGYRSADRATGHISRLRNLSGREIVPTAPIDLGDSPSQNNIRRTQKLALQRPDDLTADDDGPRRIHNQIWIPTSPDVLKLNLLIVARTG